MERREFLQLAVAGTALGLGVRPVAHAAEKRGSPLISPGCRRSKVKVARIFLGTLKGGWPLPGSKRFLEAERRSYQPVFESLKDELADVDFFVDELVTSPEQIEPLRAKLKEADGILLVHLNIGITAILTEVLKAARPTVFFAIPYSGHEWATFGALLREPRGACMDCILSTDKKQLATAIRPFRALHHLREAKILNLSTRQPSAFVKDMKDRFGTEIKQIDLPRMVQAYEKVSEADGKAEARRWIANAMQIDPSEADIIKAARQALAFERLLAEEDATVMTVDCYGSMWDKTIKLPAYPCLGFSYLNGLGLAGICESDLPSAMTFIIFQGLVGRPGFISDPTVDESTNAIILAHCTGTVRMAGLTQPADRYKLRTVMERQEGVVMQVFMRAGENVTQAKLINSKEMLYFTGRIVDAPDVERGCRTKITVKVDGDAEKLWRNWSQGLHRVTCYGDLRKDLTRFCRLAQIKLVDEAV
jgi:hypothetical protein